jgi:cardiolipin synthase (CMP-forming)
MTLANWLTVLRIVLIPFFVSSLIYREIGWALAFFLSAVLTDILDGFVARRTQVTSLGKFLDPLADKLLLVSAFVLLPILDGIPVWVTVVVVSRDVIIALGYLLIYLNWSSTQIKVRLLGKVTTFMQSLCVGGALLSMLLKGPEWIAVYLAYGVALVTAGSGLDYILQGVQRANQLAASRKSGTLE